MCGEEMENNDIPAWLRRAQGLLVTVLENDHYSWNPWNKCRSQGIELVWRRIGGCGVIIPCGRNATRSRARLSFLFFFLSISTCIESTRRRYDLEMGD